MNNALERHFAKLSEQERAEEEQRNRQNQFRSDVAAVLSTAEGRRVFSFIFSLFREGEGNLSPQELIYQQGQRDIIRAVKRALTVPQVRAIEDQKWQN